MEWEAIYRVLGGINSGKKDYLSNSERPRKTHSYLRKRLMDISGEIKHDKIQEQSKNKGRWRLKTGIEKPESS